MRYGKNSKLIIYRSNNDLKFIPNLYLTYH